MSAQESSICYRIEWPEGWPQAAKRPRFTTSFEVAKTRCRQGAVVTPLHEPLKVSGACDKSAEPSSRQTEASEKSKEKTK